ncbi:MAG: hypothetical protein EPO58_10110 [Chitinophagaceae bacterium]|nr:MAG: hypothetical protein EPO58_10110 [Chitinophagaceae bacterium]
MKIIVVIFFIASFTACAQENTSSYWPTNQKEIKFSGIVIPASLTSLQEENLNILCRVWGFLKYFHPKVAGGKVNADKALFIIILDVLNAPNKDSLQHLLFNWVNQLGAVSSSGTNETAKNVFIEPTMHWLGKDYLITGKLRMQLLNIFQNRHVGNGYYVKKKPVGNLDFSKEFRYRKIKGEDAGMRLLALFRYWNIVEYYFPSKYLTADNWDATLKKFIPKFAVSQTDSVYRMTCYELVASIHDSHAAGTGNDEVSQKYRGEYILPAVLKEVEDKIIVVCIHDTLQNEYGLKISDEIIAINGQPIQNLIESIKPYISGSNNTALIKFALYKLGMSQMSQNKLTIGRGNEVKEIQVQYMPISKLYATKRWFSCMYNYPMYKKLDADIGYINLGKIKKDSLSVIFNDFLSTKGIIIDIRNYPSEFMPFELGKYLKPNPSIFANIAKPDLSLPGRFIKFDPIVNGESNPNYYKGRIVILVDDESMSQSEYTAMALRSAPNAIVIGSQTMGADGDISLVFMPGGIVTVISGLGIYYPDWKPTQGKGIDVDIEIKPTIKGIGIGKDEILEAATKYIKENPVKNY